ncbi:hypothetical protein F4804DRAFT_305818 [Jackrogersella minutella]|nr:hypothetical protein F4804DRAFT_305818 [Jackrogersella minutella]
MIPPEISVDDASEMVVEIDSRFTDTGNPKLEDGEDMHLGLNERNSWWDSNGPHICYSPWDSTTFFAHMMESEATRMFNRESRDWYITCLLKIISAEYEAQPCKYFKRISSSIYETERRRLANPSHVPSLTDDSTLSDISELSIVPQLQIYIDDALESHGEAQLHQINLDDALETHGEDQHIISPSRSRGYKNKPIDNKDCWTIATELPCSELEGSPDDKMKAETTNSKLRPQRQHVKEVVNVLQFKADIQSQFHGSDSSKLLDPETSTDTSSRDEGEDDDEEEDDPSETLHWAIRRAFHTHLADKIIDYLLQLPPDRKARVYEYRDISLHDNDEPPESCHAVCHEGNFMSKKRKRSNSKPRISSVSKQVQEGDGEENQIAVDRRPSAKPSVPLFACAYHIYDSSRYGPRTTARYKSCGGPGFKTLNHYKRHLERKHIIQQCSRCGHILESLQSLHNHLAQELRCTIVEFEQEGMSQQAWEGVTAAFRRSRGNNNNPSDEERWFRAWDSLFPEVDRPPSPYYEQHYPLIFTRTQEIFEAGLPSLPLIAQNPSLRDAVVALLRGAIDAATQSTPFELEANDISPSLPPVPVPTSNTNLDDHVLDEIQASYMDVNPHSSNQSASHRLLGSAEQSGYAGNDPSNYDLSFLSWLNDDANCGEDQGNHA